MAPFILGDGRLPLQVALVPGKEVCDLVLVILWSTMITSVFNVMCLNFSLTVAHGQTDTVPESYYEHMKYPKENLVLFTEKGFVLSIIMKYRNIQLTG